mmetsp:Transcript_5356/g.6181  ORF Transcript_5356/g.6181 Transcript_5356/m.6181 type:complete len:162 (-) Transcript_5356:848-1333(-)
MSGAILFASLDNLKGYNQFPVSFEASQAFVIMTSRGLYRFLRVPMGYHSSVAWYQFVMQDEVLRDLYYKIALGYLDDIQVFAKSSAQFLLNLRIVLQRYRDFGIKINIRKSTFLQTQIKYCGRVFSKIQKKIIITKGTRDKNLTYMVHKIYLLSSRIAITV